MAKQIKRADIAEDDVFKGVRDSAKETLNDLGKLNDELKETVTILKSSISGAKFGNTDQINKFTTAIKAASKAMKDAQQIDKLSAQATNNLIIAEKEIERVKREKLKTQQEEIKTAKMLSQEEERLAKAHAKTAKEAENEANAYKILEKETRAQKNESKALGAEMLRLESQGKKNSKEYRELAGRFKEVTAAAQKGDAQLKKLDKTVGDNFRNVGNYRDALGGINNVLGKVGLGVGIGAVLGNAAQTIAGFDQKVADLKSITGLKEGSKDLAFFKEQAIEMGKAVEGGAGEVIEAYKLIGSAKPELLENAKALNAVTQSAITLSQASGMTLPDAATALTDALNQFGAPADEAGKFINVLANGALAGSAEIPQVTEALLKFGAVANTSNVSIEESTALIESLADKGLKGAEAGTALRNVMLKLSAPDALPKEAQERLQGLGISFADLQDKSKPFSERLKVLKPLLNDSAAMVKVFGTENAVAATNLIANTDRISELNDKMFDMTTANTQAEARTQTLSFALNSLKESWNALILGFMNGTGSTSLLTTAIGFLAENLGTIVAYIGKAALAFGIYKTAVLGAQAKNFLFNGGLKQTASSMLMVFKSTKQAADGAKAAGAGMATAGKAMVAVPWMMVITLAIELGTALYNIASGADDAARATENYNKAVANGQKYGEKWSTQITEQYKQTKELLDLQLSEGSITKKVYEEKLKAARDFEKRRLITEIKLENENKDRYKRTISGLQKYYDEAIGTWSTFRSTEQVQVISRYEGAREGIAESNEIIKAMYSSIKAMEAEDISAQIDKNNASRQTATDKTAAHKAAVKELNTTLADQNEYLSEQNALLDELAALDAEEKITALDAEIKTLTEDLGNLAEAGLDYDTTTLEAKINERAQIEKDAIEARLSAEKTAILEKYRLDSEAAKAALEKAKKDALAQKDLTPEAKKLIEDDYKAKKEQLDRDDLQREADKELELKKIAKKGKQELLAIETQSAEDINAVKNELNDKAVEAEQKRLDKEAEDAEKLAAKRLQDEKDRAREKMEIAKMLADYAIKKSNERIAQIEKEITAAENESDRLKELANNGNIQAKESIAVQQKLIAEANQAREAEQRKQQRIKLAETVYTTYQGKVESGSKNPLADTIKDTALLQAFISSLPTYYDGTENTGNTGQGIDGKGGFLSVLHPNERVLTSEQNDKIGNISNNDLAKVALEYGNGQLFRKGEGSEQIGGAWQTAQIVKKLTDLEAAINNKPETNIGLEQIIEGAITITKTKKQGNSLTFDRYKIKP